MGTDRLNSNCGDQLVGGVSLRVVWINTNSNHNARTRALTVPTDMRKICLPISLVILAAPAISPHAQSNEFATKLKDSSSSASTSMNTTFCELVADPVRYFGKTVRIRATFEQATEGQYLLDETCGKTERIGVGYQDNGARATAVINRAIEKIHSAPFNGRASVAVTGILRNAARHDFVRYNHRFDIMTFEAIDPWWFDSTELSRTELPIAQCFASTPHSGYGL